MALARPGDPHRPGWGDVLLPLGLAGTVPTWWGALVRLRHHGPMVRSGMSSCRRILEDKRQILKQ
eukprot:9356968-Pyramimonas_sp.AAC.1